MVPVNRTLWTYETIKNLAQGLKTRSELKSANHTAYITALKNGWLDEFFPK
jgi:hypothetical protein